MKFLSTVMHNQERKERGGEVGGIVQLNSLLRHYHQC